MCSRLVGGPRYGSNGLCSRHSMIELSKYTLKKYRLPIKRCKHIYNGKVAGLSYPANYLNFILAV